MFGRIVPLYDLLNRVLSLGLDQRWRQALAREVRVAGTGIVLDLAAGTLDVALAIGREHPQALVPALDFCLPMLERGQRKLCADTARRILPIAADAKRLPLPDASVDSVTMAFGIRNITPRAAAFGEMLRVLAPGGRACILEFGSGQERIWGGLYNFYLNRLLPLVGRLVSRDATAYAYLADTICKFPSASRLEDEMRAAGFARVWHRKLTSGIVCLHVGEKAALAAQ
ncbi:MAG: ubiquinone/menaquinone biosynthesis methyltransferase [Desulfovibrio sp.]|nr:ubiquinone/menaquinone biosynthesis methyltransferase [Desulfovibrio sp.]